MGRWSILCGCLLAAGATSPAWAGDKADCPQATDPGRSIAACSRIIASGSGSREYLAKAYTNRGVAYENEGDSERGIADESKAIELNPSDAAAYYDRANGYAGMNDYDHAIVDYSKAIEIDPKFTNAYSNRALAYNKKDDFDREIADESKAIELDPKDPDIYFNRADAYAVKRDYGQAISDYTSAIDLNPKLGVAYIHRGWAYHIEGDEDRAIIDESKAIELDPGSADPYFRRGTAYFEKAQYERAIADYDEAIAIDPQYVDAYFGRGNAYHMKHDQEHAIADFNKTIELNPQHPGAFAYRGTVYEENGDYERAIADESTAINLKADFGYAYAERGEAHRENGERRQALGDFRTGLKLLHANDEFYQMVVARIAGLEQELASAAPKAETKSAVTAAAPTPEVAAAEVAPASLGRRVALVIGNSAYRTVTPLRNPRKDAELMARTLEQVGFKVTKVIDADQQTMKRALVDFERTLRDGVDVGLFYYSGHGVQARERNYLVPVNASISDEDEVAIESVDVNDFLATMESAQSKINIVILDACRNNPFAGSFRSASRGLAMVEAPHGTYIAYATAPGSVAEDGDGEDSTYTEALARAIQEPGLQVEQTFKEVRRLVAKATGGRQVTWDQSSITGDFFFTPATTPGK